MKRLTLFFVLLLLASSCSDDGDVFYTDTYSVVRIEGQVTLNTPDETPATTALIEQIRQEIVANSLVQAGGSYTLLYTLAYGGRVEINTGTDKGSLTAAFNKTPGTTTLRILYDTVDFTLTQSTYTEENTRLILYTNSQTDYYKARYPDLDLKEALLLQYTSHKP